MIITVNFHQENGEWWAESPDIEGLSAAAKTLDACRKLMRAAISLERPFADTREHIIYEEK